MRTTITMDDHLFEKLKERAAETRVSVSRLIEQAVWLQMRAMPPSKRKGRFNLVTFGAGGKFSQRNVDKASALLEAEDIERFARRRK